jgi:hypothetical protein
MGKLKLSSRVMRVGARSILLAVGLAAYVIAACATGGDGETLEGGSGSPDSPVVSDGPAHAHDTSFPDSYQNADTFVPPKDSAPPVDSFIPPEDSSLPDVLPFDVIPFDVTLPKDASADAPFMDAGGGKVNCPITFKYLVEAEIASSTEDPPMCSAGCTATQCCFKPAGICLTK